MVRVSTEEDQYETSHSPSPPALGNFPPISSNLTRCQSMKSPKRNKDLRSTAILRSASGTKLNKLDGSGAVSASDQKSDSNSQENLSKTPPPGMPIATLAIRRDSFNMNQGKSRSMTCLLAAAASAAEIAGQPVLVSHARTRSYLCGSVGPTSMLGAEELEKYFPDRNVRVFVGSWNMNGQMPPPFLADFLLPLNIGQVCH